MSARLPPATASLLTVQPDDRLLLESDATLSRAQMDNLGSLIAKWLAGESPRLLILDNGLRLKVVRKVESRVIAWLVRSKDGKVRACWTTEPDETQRAIAAFDGDTITPLVEVQS